MAIQIPNPGTGNGASGDNEFVLWTKTKDNFSNSSHAASRLVGVGAGNVLEMTARGIANSGLVALTTSTLSNNTANTPSLANPSGFYKNGSVAGGDMSTAIRNSIVLQTPYTDNSNNPFAMQLIIPATSPYGLYIRRKDPSSDTYLTATELFYSNFNTTKEAGTGYLVASSPVLKVQHDSFEKVHEAEQLDIEVKNIKTGVYEITGTTGLREGDGWNLKPPKDVNGNVLCICEASEKVGVITLKTYKKKFDFETVSIVADYEQPTDIPEGATVMLRFNDLPQENLDDTQTEEVGLDK